MSPTLRIGALALVLLVATSGCKDKHPHGEYDHAHARNAHAGEEAEMPAQSVTIWTRQTELFMEYDPLVVGRESCFAAHLTTMNDFKAVHAGVLSLSVKGEDGSEVRAKAEEPSSPGIFRFTLEPSKSGPVTFTLHYEGQGIADTIDAGQSKVFSDEKAARAGLPEESDSGIAYTKEQQWKTDFATEEIGKQPLQPSVQAAGEIKAVSGREARITAPARGRLTLASPAPLPGMPVKKKQLLGSVSPYLGGDSNRPTLDADVESAKAELAAAKSQLERLERLLKEQAVPERRVDEARTRLRIAETKIDGAKGRLAQYNQGVAGVSGGGPGAFRLRSPIEGVLVDVNGTHGDSVEEGKRLFLVVDLAKVWVVAKIFEPDIPKVESAKAAWFTIEGYEKPFSIDEKNGRLITIGRVLDPKSRTVQVIFEMKNPDGKIRIGQYAQVYIATGATREVLAVPTSAILDDGGKQVLFVQTEGETFVRKVVKTGIRAKGWVQIVEGVEAGQRVVKKGAYDVRLAAASGAIPKHGHVH